MLTVNALFARYLSHVRQDGTLCPAALAQREKTLADFAGRYGSIAVADLRPYHLTDWIADHPGWRAPSTRALKACEVRAAFSWAYAEERIDRNPFRNVRYAPSPRRPEMPDDVLERLIQAGGPCFANLLRFLRLTGARISEVCNARCGDFDLNKGLWTIHRHKGRRATKKPKIVPLTGEAVQLLIRNRDELQAATAAAGIDVVGETPAVSQVIPPVMAAVVAKRPVFFNSRGTPWTPVAARMRVRWLCRRLRIKRQCLHSIRHMAATAAIRAGVPLKFVSLMLGHRSVSVTAAFYDHVTVESDMEAVRAAAEAARPAWNQSINGGKENRP